MTSVALLAIALAGVALLLAVDNPAISHTARGDKYACLAPWDTVLNDADNYPGGEPPTDGDQIEQRCRQAGEDRFKTAMVLAAASGAVAVTAGVVGLVARRRDRRPTTL